MINDEDCVVVGWSGLPAYAARLIKAVDSDFPVIASRPSVPIDGMDAILPQRILWINEGFVGGWVDLGVHIPRFFFQPSWSDTCFNKLGDEVRTAGGKVIVMFDNSWRGDLRQFIGAIVFRTLWRNRFAAAWVPGASGRRLARFWGFSSDSIFDGIYGADPALFSCGEAIPLRSRPKRVLFVGQLIDRKGIRELLEAWENFHPRACDWELHIYGSGPLDTHLVGRSVVFHGFQQPEVIALAMRQSRFLILPSHEEHWGLVVCEAAQAGCGLLLSKEVGSHLDLCNNLNGVVFKSKDSDAILAALLAVSHWTDLRLDEVQSESIRLGSKYTPENWAKQFRDILVGL
jgi:glycosyltransferase involved in cell wall biosynthesis